MKIHRTTEDISLISRPVVTLGTFDGVHKGHQQIIHRMNAHARRLDGESVLFTFHPHPRMVLHPEDHQLELIQTIGKRMEFLEQSGVDHLVLFPFTVSFSRLSPVDFVRNVLVNQLHVHVLIIGYNHHFGKNREGDIELLRELSATYGFEVDKVPAFREGGVSISSTKIRRALREGAIETANHYLGRPFSFEGKVIRGDAIGATIGFPTANIGEIDHVQIIPQTGVYAVRVRIDGTVHDGMMNIGFRPTVSRKSERRVEVHLFQFNTTIYGLVVSIIVLGKVRDEQRFTGLDALKIQLEKDARYCRQLLAQMPANS